MIFIHSIKWPVHERLSDVALILILSVLLPADLDLLQVVTLETLQLMLWAITGYRCPGWDTTPLARHLFEEVSVLAAEDEHR